MPKFANEPLLDDATLKRMDDEFRTGAYDQIHLPPMTPVDPTNDPFGMDFEWLEPSPKSTDFLEVWSAVQSQPRSEWNRIAAESSRRSALGGTLAGGTDEQIFQRWAAEGFVGICYGAGQSGIELLTDIRGDREIIPERAESILTLFREQLPKTSLTMEEQVAVAMAIIQALKLPD